MLTAGDEIGRTQGGNNNAYSQDNPISWVDWTLDDEKAALLAFTRRMIALRRAHPVFRRRDFFQGRAIYGGEVSDIHWFKPDGTEMTQQDWEHEYARALGVLLIGEALQERDARGRPVVDDNFLLMFNAGHKALRFRLPIDREPHRWQLVMDTAVASGLGGGAGQFRAGALYTVQARATVLMQQLRIEA
jgi:glycogen operon protein